MKRPAWRVLALAALLAGCSRAPAPPPAPSPEPLPPAARPDTLARARPDTITADTLPAPPPPAPVRAALPVRIALTGDINLGTSTLPDGLPPDSGRGLLSAVDSLLRGDLVIGNLEGTLADTGTTEKCPEVDTTRARRSARPPGRRMCYVFLTPVYLGARLRDAGFTHLNLANNHAHDYGLAGRRSTEATLEALGLATYGPGGRIAVDTVRRGDSLTVVGVVGFATYPSAPNLLDLEASARLVDSIRREVDILLVTFHGGAEGSIAQHTPDSLEYLGREPRGHLRAWARRVIDAGADAVVGHGPHVLRGMEFYRGRLIAYSLGNFLTYRGFNLQGPNGLTTILQLEFAGDGTLRQARAVPLRQPPRQGPRPDPSGRAVQVMRALSGEDFGASAARFGPDGTIGPPGTP